MSTHDTLVSNLSIRSIVLVGLMGSGKTCVGRCLARALELPFVDADQEIEVAAGCSIKDFFELYGEQEFRKGEAKVIRRLLGNGAQILATGGGAFMNEQTRHLILKNGISVWLKANLETLTRRTARRKGRPLLINSNPGATLEKLINIRYPVYASADITIETGHENVNVTTEKVLNALQDFTAAPGNAEPGDTA